MVEQQHHHRPQAEGAHHLLRRQHAEALPNVLLVVDDGGVVRSSFVGPVSREPRSRALPDWWPDLDGSRPVVHVSQGTVANATEPAGTRSEARFTSTTLPIATDPAGISSTPSFTLTRPVHSNRSNGGRGMTRTCRKRSQVLSEA